MAVETVAATRAALTEIVARFRAADDAQPVVFGRRRVPEAALLPYAQYRALMDLVEDLRISQVVEARVAAEQGGTYSLEDVAAEFGVDPADL